MATARISALALSRRAVTVARPRVQLATHHKITARPLLTSYPRRIARYSTAAADQPRAPKIDRAASKLYKNADEAVADLKSGSTILSSGFGLCGVAGMMRLS